MVQKKLLQMVTDLNSLKPEDHAPGIAGHHLEASDRGWCNKQTESILHDGRDELAREFQHFNSRFRGRMVLKPGNVQKITRVSVGKCMHRTSDSSLHYCVVNGNVPAVGRVHTNEKSTRQVWHEIAIWSQVAHPHIVKMIGITYVNDKPCVLSEYHGEGSLYDANRRQLRLLTNSPLEIHATPAEMTIGGGSAFPPSASAHSTPQTHTPTASASAAARPELLLVEWARNIASAMAYLHTLTPVAILHRNLKSSNVLLSAGGTRLLITDFATACPLSSDMTPAVGSVRWMAPELLNDMVYSEHTDVYAFAMLCFEMLTYTMPFEHCTIQQAAFKVAAGERPTLPSSTPQWIFELITTCWRTKPDARPTFPQISTMLDKMVATLSLLTFQQCNPHNQRVQHAGLLPSIFQ
uniref:Protein kinase domain-containing protein n=1 Tax=Haptolina brevifila TaxID=156173 RepID=A0A7S2NFT9_9EUKA|mmetsp:Transcript_76452/g.151544  ORF Transcript_76452/g.151544 Transcript_76452/m.151544 type:complete len:408 (+) Transcript_76452:152-1375(+)